MGLGGGEGGGAHICHPLLALRQQAGARPTTLCEGRARTGAEVVARVAAACEALRVDTGVSPGDRVALLGHSSDFYLEAFLAAAAAGAIVAPLNWRWGAGEAGAAFRRCGCEVLLVDAACALQLPALRAACPGLREVVHIGVGAPPPGARALEAAIDMRLCGGEGGGAPPPLVLHTAPGRAALICFTSGTTSEPKGVVLTHEALVCQSLAKLAEVGYGPTDVYLHAAPLFHIGGISSALAVLMARGAHIFIPKFTPAAAAAAVREAGVTCLIAVPAMLVDMTAALDGGGGSGGGGAGGDVALPTVRTLLVGGGALFDSVLAAAVRMMPNARIMTAYGMTEAASSMTFRLLRGGAGGGAGGGGASGVGTPAPHVQVAVRRIAGWGGAGGAGGAGGEAEVGEEGEVVTRGPHVMAGYWGSPELTAEVLQPDGWLRTGDVGYLDASGCLHLSGRLKDVVKSGGENVHALEVEGALGSHPGVAEAAVVGAPDPRLGEAVAALVALRPGWRWAGPVEAAAAAGAAGGGGGEVVTLEGKVVTLEGKVVTLEGLRAHCRAAGLTGYKVPRVAAATGGGEPLPRNAGGKLVKAEVRALLEAARAPKGAGGGMTGFSKL